MCLIIQKPKGVELPEELLSRAFKQNHDGWGIMAVVDGRLQVSKGFKYEKLKKAVDYYAKSASSDTIIHLRYKTHGAIDLENCHPFRIGKEVALMHNGVMSNVDCSSDRGKSDTWHLCRILGELYGEDNIQHFVDKTHFIFELEGYTSGNRLIILRKDGKAIRYHEKSWTEWQGLYLSNNYATPTQAINYRDRRAEGKSACQTGCSYSGNAWEDAYWNNYKSDDRKKKASGIPSSADVFTMYAEVKGIRYPPYAKEGEYHVILEGGISMSVLDFLKRKAEEKGQKDDDDVFEVSFEEVSDELLSPEDFLDPEEEDVQEYVEQYNEYVLNITEYKHWDDELRKANLLDDINKYRGRRIDSELKILKSIRELGGINEIPSYGKHIATEIYNFWMRPASSKKTVFVKKEEKEMEKQIAEPSKG